MVGWHYQLDGHEFEQALGVGDGQGSLVCCSPWSPKGSDAFEQLNRTEFWNSVYVAKDLEKAMAIDSSTPVLENPTAEEPGRLQSMGSLRVEHDWATSLSLFTFIHWRRKWQPTPVFLSGESQGRESLVGCRLWGRTELDTTEAT